MKEDEKQRAERLREAAFPDATCPASRHVMAMADAMADGEKLEDPEHCADSLYATVASLWEVRMERAALTSLLEKAGEALARFTEDNDRLDEIRNERLAHSVVSEIEAYKANKAPLAPVKASGTGERE